MEIHLTDQFKADITKLKKQNAKLLAKLWELIVDIDNNSENHLAGMGNRASNSNSIFTVACSVAVAANITD